MPVQFDVLGSIMIVNGENGISKLVIYSGDFKK